MMIKYREPLFRPPAEADSLIFQVAYGCPHNRCRFCGMYKTVNYRPRPPEEVLAEMAQAGNDYSKSRRIFLADGDVMALPFDTLKCYLEALNDAFPELSRVNIYANGSSILRKTPEQLLELKRLKLNTLYVGLESGSQEVLDLFGKTEQAQGMTEAVIRTQDIGFKCSVMLLIGLGGQKLRQEHIERSIEILNCMQPKLLSALRYILIPELPLPSGYEPVTEYEAVSELREIISGLDLKQTVFRANHTSNPVSLAGRFPHDKEALKELLSAQLRSGMLDTQGPGAAPLFL